jgi:signal transduction histidine kinase
MASRVQSIRTKILALVAVPLIALFLLWGFAVWLTLGDSFQVLKADSFDTKVTTPTETVIEELQNERRDSLAYLGKDPSLPPATLADQRARTDKAIAVFRQDSVGDSKGLVSAQTRRRLTELSGQLGNLADLRASVDARTAAPATVLGRFSTLVDASYSVYDPAYPGTAELTKEAMTILLLSEAREVVSREDALMAGALAVNTKLSDADRIQFGQYASQHRLLYAQAARTLRDSDQARYQAMLLSPGYARFQALEDEISLPTTGRRAPLTADTWHAAAAPALDQLWNLQNDVYYGTLDRAHAHAVAVVIRLAAAGGAGLLAVVLSSVIALRVGRRLVRESRAMSAAVHTFAQDELPEITETARRGERPAGHFSVEGLTVREIKQISESFEVARGAVVEATVREAVARKGLSDIFVNLARRSQTLLHRQLSLLDSMERSSEGSEELKNLFQLDHLATRMRRHADGLVILSGRPAGRPSRTPVPFIDVGRGAAAEVEDYARVEVLPMPDIALNGPAVTDIIHLLAELIENSTLYSPPGSPIRVSGDRVGNGFAFEIEDRGLGMTPDQFETVNSRLAEAPEFDPADSARLGLFVVAQLAARHGVQVTMRPSPYGGATAIVLLPSALIADPTAAPPPPPPPPPELEPVRILESVAAPEPAGDTDLVNGDPELPRRRRQSNLAPQLLDDREEPVDPAGRTPESARALASAMQRGWTRGRDAAGPDAPSGGDDA